MAFMGLKGYLRLYNIISLLHIFFINHLTPL
jgi:hypothetical protein